MLQNTAETISLMVSSDLPLSLKVQSEKIEEPEALSSEISPREEEAGEYLDGHCSNQNNEELCKEGQEPDKDDMDEQDKVEMDLHARRCFNAMFLATRKFEMIE
jgi:hypothetical protein